MENIKEIRKKPGESNAGKYNHVKASNFAGPDHTFPINSVGRARNALARAHFAKDPEAIRAKVHNKYPTLAKRAHERGEKDSMNKSGVSNGQRQQERKNNDVRYSRYK